jgi:branched-subunit amino acid aminotransferase/4-amino-4-deoxychorismate lyase
VHVLSHGLHYAGAVFEGERAYNGEIFELTMDSQRLVDGAKTLDFEIPYSVAEIDEACRQTIKAGNLVDCYVRPIAWRGHLAECTSDNIFFVKGTELHSPSPDCFLDGITRQTVIGLAKKRGYTCIDRTIMPDEQKDFNECFMVRTAAEVTPIKSTGHYEFSPGTACEALLNDDMAVVQPGKAAAE